MKTLGLIGGTSWHSTVEYYRYINEAVNKHFGDNTNPPLLVYTLNQAAIHKHQINGDWQLISESLLEAAKSLKAAGAESLLFCANTPHKIYPTVQEQIDIPIIHIGDATAKMILSQGIDCVCFLGTKYSMTERFIVDRYQQHGVKTIVPEDLQCIEELHRIIQKELTFGNILPESKQYVIDVINSVMEQGAKGVVLGCTEFPLMLRIRISMFPSSIQR